MLTDGEATDPHEEILDLVKNSSGLVRVYTLGIGSGSDRKLLINMSKKGHGEVVSMATKCVNFRLRLLIKMIELKKWYCNS